MFLTILLSYPFLAITISLSKSLRIFKSSVWYLFFLIIDLDTNLVNLTLNIKQIKLKNAPINAYILLTLFHVSSLIVTSLFFTLTLSELIPNVFSPIGIFIDETTLLSLESSTYNETLREALASTE